MSKKSTIATDLQERPPEEQEDTISALEHEEAPLYDPATDTPEALSRRKFLGRLSIALGGATAVIVGVPVIGYLIGPLFVKAPEVWRAVGSITDFKVGETKQVSFADASPLPWSGVTAQTAAWVRREAETKFTAFAVNCTHLGCPVTWLPGAELFMCPCHGGVYYKDGSVAGGPPPKPLPQYDLRIVNNTVEIKASGIPFGELYGNKDKDTGK
jgi:menaquinol-cytochrome c reductase iron-sulfur subunit